MAQYASTNRTALSYIEEASFGVDPGTAKQELRYTGESVNFNISNITSDEIRSDRQTSDLVQVSAEAAGDFNFELSADSYDELMEGALASSWGGIAAAVTTASSTAGGDTTCSIVAPADEFDGVLVGQKVVVDDGTTSGTYIVASVDAGTDTIVVTDPLDTILTVAGAVTVSGGVLRNGVELHSYTLEKELQDANPVASFKFLGMRVGAMNLDFSIGSILTGSFGFMGLDSEVGAAVTPVATDPTTTGVMNSVGDVGDILIDGTESTACFNSLTLALANGLRGQDCIGTLGHSGIALGRIDLTGNISIYFQDTTEYTKFINASSFSLSFTVTDNDNKKYIVTLPEVKYETMTIVSGGLDADVMVDATWRAIIDPTLEYTIEIVRA